MMTLLIVIAVLGQSFDVVPQEVELDVQTIERAILCLKKDATAEIALSDVWLEPVHDSTIWLSHECAQVEPCLPIKEDTQDASYFK